MKRTTTTAILSEPLLYRDHLIGVITTSNEGTGRSFTEEDRNLLSLFAAQAAIAIENARLYTVLEDRVTCLRSLTHLNQLISSSLEVDAVLSEIAQAAVTLMNAPLVSFWLADEGTQTLELRSSSDKAIGAISPIKKLSFGQGGLGWVATHRCPLNIPNVFADERMICLDWHREHGLSNFFAIPILCKDSLLAILALNGQHPFRFDPEDQALLESFIAQAGIAIQNASLYTELQTSEKRFRQIAEHLPVVLWMTDAQGDKLIYISRAYEEIWGRPLQSLYAQSRSWLEAVHPADRAHVIATLKKREQGEFHDEEYRIVHTNGTTRWIRGRAFPIRNEHGEVYRIAGVTEDITERKRVEEERTRHAAQLQALAKAALVINSMLSSDDLLRVITEQAREIIGAHQSVISFTLNKNGAPSIQHVSLSEKYAAYREYNTEPDGSGIYRLVCQMNCSMRMTQAELEAHPAWRGFSKEAGKHPPLRGWLAAPLIGHEGQTVGLLQLSDKYVGEFTENDEAILVQLAQMASIAIENSRLFEEIHASHQQLQALSHRLFKAQEIERRYIACELHDEIGQTLTAVEMNVLAASRIAKSPRVRSHLQESIQLVERALHGVRDLSLDLRPSLLDDLGLASALRWYINRQGQQAGIETTFIADPSIGRLSPEVETSCYRVVQEALTNVIRHAKARKVTVELRSYSDGLHLTVRDDGIGFDVHAARERAIRGESLGVLGMQERVELIEGQIKLHSAPGHGTEIYAIFPSAPLQPKRY